MNGTATMMIQVVWATPVGDVALPVGVLCLPASEDATWASKLVINASAVRRAVRERGTLALLEVTDQLVDRLLVGLDDQAAVDLVQLDISNADAWAWKLMRTMEPELRSRLQREFAEFEGSGWDDEE
jgi:hypothetical protein